LVLVENGNALLFLAVLITMTVSGALIADALPVRHEELELRTILLRGLPAGLSFSLPLLAILLCHELGHYLTARRYQLSVSPPFFIPGLPAPWGIGTFGAFIRLRTIVNDRRQLLDVGAAGPIAGFLVALPILWSGSRTATRIADDARHRHGGAVGRWGAARRLDRHLVVRHWVRRTPNSHAAPVAFAGWFGMFVTMLNLLPMAQLDGGHIVYAAATRWHQRVARAIWVVIMLLGWYWIGWLLWGFIVLVLSRGQLRHPPVLDAYRPLPRRDAGCSWRARCYSCSPSRRYRSGPELSAIRYPIANSS
jgi:membrane-associated protease RseP (regulator of RpoE activity)